MSDAYLVATNLPITDRNNAYLLEVGIVFLLRTFGGTCLCCAPQFNAIFHDC